MLIVYVPALNDSFSNRSVLAGPYAKVQTTTFGTTREPGEPDHGGTGGGSVWWTWRAPLTGATTIDTIGSSFDTLLSIYTGNALSNLVLVASDDQSGGNDTSKIVLNAVEGTDYQIVVDGFNGARGTVVLRITPARPYLLPQRSSTLISVFGLVLELHVIGQPNTPFVIEHSLDLTNWQAIFPTTTNKIFSTGEYVEYLDVPTRPERSIGSLFWRVRVP